MARITEDSINKVRLRANIVETISDYVELKKRGQNFFGNCPFHNEKTASLSVSEDKEIYKCFGCHKGGGIFNFIMDIENVEFPEAIEILAKKNGVQLEYEKGFSKKSQDLKTEILEIHKLANSIYLNNISQNSTIKSYLYNRGFNDNILEEFQIGFSHNSSNHLLKLLQKEKFSSKAMINSGLFIKTEKGYIDRFRNRIIFPLHNHMGNIIGFTGRAVNPEDKAKYLNSPETPIYIKSKLLYGLWKTKKNIIDIKNIIIVEGQTDFLKLYQAGINNIVAASGTAFTDEHAIQIKRLTNKACLLYDGDDAGKKAAIRAGYILLKHGLESKIIEIPDGIDPDEWLEQEDLSIIKEKLDNGLDVISFHFKYEADSVKTDVGKTKFINDCLSNIRNIEDPVYKELQIKKVSRVTSISEDSILSLFDKITKKTSNKSRSSNKVTENKTASSEVKENKNIKLEDTLIKLCFAKDYDTRMIIFENFNVDWLKNKVNVNIFNELYIHLNSEDFVGANFIIEKIKDTSDREYLTTLLFDLNDKILNPTVAKECINRLKQSFMIEKIDSLRESIKENPDNNKLESILSEINDLQREMNENI